MTSASRGALGASWDRVLNAMQAANGGGRVERGADYVKVCCPAHGDTHPSCSLTYDRVRGKTRVHCFVCTDDAPVLAAAGLTVADLFDEPLPPKAEAAPSRRSRRPQPKVVPPASPGTAAGAKKPGKKDDGLRRRQVCDYVYRNVAGEPVGKVVRFDLVDDAGIRVDKSFRPMRFDQSSRRWRTGAFEPLVYRAPEVAAAVAAGEQVYLTEGEKDADVAVELGGVGTTNPGGAGSFGGEHARQLAGARVVAVLDRDLAGYERGVRLTELLFADEPVAELRLVEPFEGKDLADHRDRGHGLGDLVDVVDPAAKFVAAIPDAVAAAVAKGKPEAVIRQMVAKARAMLDKLTVPAERPALEELIEQAVAAHLGAGAPVDEVAQRREQRQRQHAEAGAGEVGAFVGEAPARPIPTSSGVWAFSTGEDEVPRGVYRRGGDDFWQMVAPLPYVLERLNRRSGEGNRTGLSYRLSMRPLNVAGEVVLLSDREVRDGTWAEMLDVPLSADDKIVKAVATAIRQLGKSAPVGEITPTWTRDEKLLMPTPDVLGGGYGELHDGEENAREVWGRIAELAGRNPKVALVAGATLGGLFVRPLLIPQRSVWVQLVGAGQHGKTTTMRLAASIVGDPATMVERWNTSAKGLGYRLSGLGCMPVFLDEMGSSSDIGTARDRENLILSLMEGAQRRVATREQGTKNSAAWHGALVGSGNDSLVDGITNEAVYARVLEVPAPITESREDCDSLNDLLTGRDVPTEQAFGWPLHWLRQDLNVARFRGLIEAAEKELPLPESGGVPRTMGRNLCLVIAGAAELDRILGVRAFQPAALAYARRLLADLVGELAEAGLKPGDRVHSAIIQAITSRPHSYPTRQQFLEAVEEDEPDAFKGGSSRKRFLPRDVEGFMLTGDPDTPGDVAILKDKLVGITKDAGITDPRPGLRELDQSGVLIRGTEKDGKRVRRLRIGHWPTRPSVYVFHLDPEDLAAIGDTGDNDDDRLDDNVGRGTGDNGTGDTVPGSSTRPDTIEPDKPPPEIVSPVSPVVPGVAHTTGDTRGEPLTRTDVPETAPGTGVVPGIPGSGDTVTCEEVMNGEESRVGGSAGARTDLDWDALLAEAGDDVDVLTDLWYLAKVEDPGNTAVLQRIEAAGRKAKGDKEPDSPTGATPPPAASQQGSQPDRVALAGPCPPPLTGFAAACVVVDPTGLYLPDGTRRTPPPIRDAYDVLAVGDQLGVGHPGGPGQVILTDAMCVEVGLVAEADAGVAGDEARRQIADRLRDLGDGFLRRARDHGWDFDHFGPETRARLTREGRTRVLDLVLTPYASLWTRGREEVTPFGALDPDETLTQEQYAAEAARLMGHLAHLLHRPWRSSAVQAGFDLFDAAQRARKKNRGHVLTVPGRLPKLTGDTTARDLVPALTWSRWTPQRPAGETDRGRIAGMTHAVHLDRIAAWISSAGQATLGYLTEEEPEMLHHHGVDAVAALLGRPEAVPAGVYRLRLPQLIDPAIPPLHPGQSTERPRWLWLPAPMVSTLIRPDDPTANVLGWGCAVTDLLTAGENVDGEEGGDKQPEAWTFPVQGRILGGQWYETLRDARYALAQHSDQDLPESELIKHVYSGMLQSTQDTKPRVIEGKRGWHHQATWLSTVKAAHYSWQWHLLRRAIYNNELVVHVDIDEIVILTGDPAGVALGAADGKVGQYRPKKVRQLSDQHREQLAAGVPADRLQGGEVS